MGSKFTPGPWIVVNATDVFTPDRDGDSTDGFQIADCMADYAMNGSREMPFSEQKANARLIAAAPDLLEALRGAYTVLADVKHRWPGRFTTDAQALLCNMRDALAKATGDDPCDISSGVHSDIIAKAMGEVS